MNKPLADIVGKPMIIHVVERAVKANIGDVFVACGDKEIADVVKQYGYNAVLTDPSLQSGSDRVFSALSKIDSNNNYDTVVNLQGDLPAIEVSTIAQSILPLNNSKVDIGTLATPIINIDEIKSESVVKAVLSMNEGEKIGQALYFTRSPAPWGIGSHYYHIGIYSYRAESLKKFVSLKQSPLEKREKLEQLRALENNMRIDVKIVETSPMSVDTPDDLEAVRKYFIDRG